MHLLNRYILALFERRKNFFIANMGNRTVYFMKGDGDMLFLGRYFLVSLSFSRVSTVFLPR